MSIIEEKPPIVSESHQANPDTPPPAPEVVLSLQNITKSFGDTKVLKGISLDVYKGEFVTLLGSSGCGKTTTLRIISGLEAPDSGVVMLNGEDVTQHQPNNREINTIFQNYALFPHMTVAQNVGYSLKLKKVPAATAKAKVKEMLDLVLLSDYGKRMPAELSGGQRQRVAIARALACEPTVLLLDEPLGALDLQLRRQMQQELKKLQKQLGITFIYITHDQEEAINMSDRIVVMNKGVFEQIGTPADVYDNPLTSFVAKFIGTANLFTGKVEKIDSDKAEVMLKNGKVKISCRGNKLNVGQQVTFSVRSEHIKATVYPTDGFTLTAKVQENNYIGGTLRIVLKRDSGKEILSSRQGTHKNITLGETVCISWDPADACLVDLHKY